MGVTLKDVAKAAGVAVSTASYVINGTGLNKVGKETQQRILSEAAKLGYTPNIAGRVLNGGRSGTVGIIMQMSFPWVYNDVPRLICMLLRKAGYQVTFGVADTQAERLAVLRDMSGRSVEGVILFNCSGEMDEWYGKLPMPMVIFDGMEGEIRMALEEGSRIAARHLLEHGHRHVGCFTSLKATNIAKIAGYRRELGGAGIAWREAWEVEAFGDHGWAAKTLGAIREEGLTAFVCNNDNYAAKLMRVLLDAGIRVPEDVALIGFDGDSFGPCLAVPLTTVVQPVNLLARRMAALMLEKIGKQDFLKRPPETLEPYLHIERSCGCSRGGGGQSSLAFTCCSIDDEHFEK